MTRFISIILLCAITFSSCHHFWGKHVRGTGNIKKMSRDAGHFSKIEVSNAFELHVKQDSTRSINIETDENLQEYVIMENDGDRLRIYSERGFNLDPSNGDKVKIYVSSPMYERLEASGACSIIGDNQLSSNEQLDIDLSGASDANLDLKMPKITVGLSGASDVTLKGETKDFSMNGSGASHARCFDLLSENADVDISGASSVETFASVKINATASGASNVRYKGNGVIGTKNESGAGSIEKIN
jgi:Putative auto-transporter adhesin, head GIN domain